MSFEEGADAIEMSGEKKVKNQSAKKIFLHMKLEKTQTAGHKAVADCETIMRKMGYEQLDIVQSPSENKLVKAAQIVIQFLKLLYVKNGVEIVIEHPLYIHYVYILCLKYVRKMKNIKFTFIIHDLEILRGLLKSKGAVKKDRIMLEIADTIIVHNEKMKKYLMEELQIEERRLVVLEIFDYLVSAENSIKCDRTENKVKRITIAGNLSKEKSSYIYKLDKLTLSNVEIYLYGANFEREESVKNCIYKGSYDADLLPNVLEGEFGLVWDGSELYKCVGNTGNYMKYNNPHKVSLYVAAELPIIIWKQAALAEFVVKNHIGITVDSLEKIEEELSKITEEQYQVFKNNLKRLSEKVRNGYYLERALRKTV